MHFTVYNLENKRNDKPPGMKGSVLNGIISGAATSRD
jgi:hypothetical protein